MYFLIVLSKLTRIILIFVFLQGEIHKMDHFKYI